MYVYMHKHEGLGGSGGMLSQEIRCSEIASEAILGQKQSRNGSRSIASNFWLSTYAFAIPADLAREGL